MDYIVLKQVHVVCAALSYTGFFVRGVWMLSGSAMLARRWVRVAPHIVDTLLLASGIALAVALQQYPLADTWLTAKLLALVLYIGLGMVALRPGRGKPLRIAAWVAAQVVFAYIVGVAVTRDALPWAR